MEAIQVQHDSSMLTLMDLDEDVTEDFLDFNLELFEYFNDKSQVTDHTKKFLSNLKKKTQQYRDHLETAPFIRLRDKLSFIVGAGNIIFTSYIMGRFPHHFASWYTFKAFALVLLRWVYYYRQKWHYFLFGFCYFANVFLLVYLHLYPHSPMLFRICFAFSTGPLAWAIVLWRNSMVFHELDKITSLFIHMSPCLLVYNLRWVYNQGYSICDTPSCSASFYDMTIIPIIPYLIWQILYIIRVNLVGKNDRMTSFRWLMEQKSGFIYRVSNCLCRGNLQFGFILSQLAYTIASFLPVKLFWDYELAQFLFTTLVLAVSIFNGANYYVEVFATRYTANLDKRAKKLEQITGSINKNK